MADLFTVTTPLLIRYPDNTRHVMVACFRCADGIVYFRPWWNELPDGKGVQLVRGSLRGEGPWKLGDTVITVLGCQGTHPQQAAELADWKFHLEQRGERYPARAELEMVARELGLLSD
ncbi:hypothetical protein N9235_01780 [Gammaproteobacteria bacterium]|nr:hypothetical protein [Gammaproteobacteria bacterium]